MLLAMDVGNTNLVIGVFDGSTLRVHWRLATRRDATADEYGVLLLSLLRHAGIPRGRLDACILDSVVPPLDVAVEEMVRRDLGVEPLVVGRNVEPGMPIRYESPRDVGADRIVNAVAAEALYGCPAIVVDFGTATTFDAISARGEYLGGAIVPGVGISADALFVRAAKLPRVEIARPKAVIGTNTVAAMQAGLFYGYVSLVDGVVRRMQRELAGEAVVVGTGGLAHLFAGEAETLTHVDPLLTLKGLELLYRRNR
jgi:type III pantothenate kinase